MARQQRFVILLLPTLLLSQSKITSAPVTNPQPPAQSVKNYCWDVLKKGLADKNPDKRRQAVTAIGSIGPTSEALKLLHSALEDKTPEVRQTAVVVLGQLKSPKSVPFLRRELEDTSEVSFTAAKVLWEMGDHSGREVFEEVLSGERKDKAGLVQGAMQDAKRKIHNPGALALMGVREASGALLGPASMGILLAQDALKDKGAPGRALAASYLASDSSPKSLATLEDALSDKSPLVRAAAAKAVGQRGNANTINKLRPLLVDTNDAAQYMAAASIIRLSTHRSHPRTAAQ